MLFSSFTASSLGNHFHHSALTHCSLERKKKKLYFSPWTTSSFICYRCQDVFSLDNCFESVLSTALNKGAQQLWLHLHHIGEILAASEQYSASTPFPSAGESIPYYIQQTVIFRLSVEANPHIWFSHRIKSTTVNHSSNCLHHHCPVC